MVDSNVTNYSAYLVANYLTFFLGHNSTLKCRILSIIRVFMVYDELSNGF